MPRTKRHAPLDIRNRVKELRYVRPSDLADHPLQWRIHGELQQQAMQGLLRDVGIAGALLAYESPTTGLTSIDGHLRKSLADTLWPTLILDVTDEEARLLLASYDPISAMAETNRAQLAALLADVTSGEAGVQALLAQLAEANGLAALTDDAPVQDVEPEVDRAEELRAQYGLEVGQLWACGAHRVLCGDCTDTGVVERVMDGETFRLLVTSPPYDDLRDYQNAIDDWQALAMGFMRAAVDSCDAPVDVLVNLGLRHKDGRVHRYHEPWLDACAAMGWPLYGWYVWDKLHGFPGEWNGRLAPCHEWLFHFSQSHTPARKWIPTNGTAAARGSKGTTFRRRDGTTTAVTSPERVGQPVKIPDSVIRLGSEHGRGLHTETHPAVFPVAFPAFIIETWSGPQSLVYDPFLGSGTTLIACEQLGRVCRGVELAPAYVAVALHRWKALTGATPTLLDG